jgi:hypothetical protein
MTPKLIASGLSELVPMQRSGDETHHVSWIIRELCIKLGHFTTSSMTPEQQTRMELGSVFEDAVVHALAARYASSDDSFVQPGEFELDGLIGTPDLLDNQVGALTVIEIKLTWMSSRWDPEDVKYWRYWVQLMAYCKLVGTPHGRLHVCHINGDYRENRLPDYKVYEVEFSRAELDENWRMLVTNGKVLRGKR